MNFIITLRFGPWYFVKSSWRGKTDGLWNMGNWGFGFWISFYKTKNNEYDGY